MTHSKDVGGGRCTNEPLRPPQQSPVLCAKEPCLPHEIALYHPEGDPVTQGARSRGAAREPAGGDGGIDGPRQVVGGYS